MRPAQGPTDRSHACDAAGAPTDATKLEAYALCGAHTDEPGNQLHAQGISTPDVGARMRTGRSSAAAVLDPPPRTAIANLRRLVSRDDTIGRAPHHMHAAAVQGMQAQKMNHLNAHATPGPFAVAAGDALPVVI